MKKLLFLLVTIFLSISSFGQLKQVEVPDTIAKDTVYVEQQINYYNYYDTDGMWYNYSPYHYSWYTPYYYDWYSPYYYNSWYSPYYYGWYTPYYYNWYTPYYTPYYYNYNYYGYNSHYNTSILGHRYVTGGYRPVNHGNGYINHNVNRNQNVNRNDNHRNYQYQKPKQKAMQYQPLYDHSQRHDKYNQSRPLRQRVDMNPDNTRYRTPATNPRPQTRPQIDRPQQRNNERPASNVRPQQRSNDRPAPTRTYSAPQRSSSPAPQRSYSPNSGGSHPSGGSNSGGGHRK